MTQQVWGELNKHCQESPSATSYGEINLVVVWYPKVDKNHREAEARAARAENEAHEAKVKADLAEQADMSRVRANCNGLELGETVMFSRRWEKYLLTKDR